MFYKTCDIQIASLLYAEGVSFIGIEPTANKRKFFVFKSDNRIADLEKAFWTETHKIAPRKYMGAFKELKNRLYS